VSYVHDALNELDRNENARMPPAEDGTPNESVADVFVRVRQLISKLETQYQGETIVVVAPDSDVLSILQCALYNEPLTMHRDQFAYAPGEVRKIMPVVVDVGDSELPRKRLSDFVKR
jgi:broad specificity phosphatase PhoE